MSQPCLLPYEELNVRIVDGNGLLLQTPWAQIEAEFSPEESARVSLACDAINSRSLSATEDVTDFLMAFHHHFIAYRSPRALTLNAQQCTRSQARVLKLEKLGAQDWIESFLPAVAEQINFSQFEWKLDLEGVLEKSQIPGQAVYDPDSAYRIIMRWILQTMSSKSKGTTLLVEHLRQLARTNEAAFFEASKLFVRQYYHITCTSSDCMTPAVDNMPYAREEVFEIVHEEHGHGKFTASTLKELGVTNPLSIPLNPHTAALMDLLRLAAHTNPLSFSVLFTIFEVSGEQDDDPLATLLEQSSLRGAERGIQNHFKLNKDGAHFMSGFPLIETLQGVDRATVVEATRMAELLMNCFDRMSRDIIAQTHVA